MTRISASIKANNQVTLLSENINQFSLTFITPLSTDYDGVFHAIS
jgi:hypothetical protein